jgi:hypothetical protein
MSVAYEIGYLRDPLILQRLTILKPLGMTTVSLEGAAPTARLRNNEQILAILYMGELSTILVHNLLSTGHVDLKRVGLN